MLDLNNAVDFVCINFKDATFRVRYEVPGRAGYDWIFDNTRQGFEDFCVDVHFTASVPDQCLTEEEAKVICEYVESKFVRQ